jgi:hypothetical protein
MDRVVVGGGIAIMAAFYLALGALLAHLLGLGDSPFLWVAVTMVWPAVIAFLGFLLFIGVAIVAKLFDAIHGRRA